jgi:hypothetical protein
VLRWTAPFVLAMLMLRAMVPAGFMLAPADGGLAVVLCDADATASLYRGAGHAMSGAGMDMSAADMAGHAMSMGDMSGHDMPGHSAGHTLPDPTCPYAQSSGATPIPFFAAVTPALESASPVLPGPAAQTHAHFGPTRQQSPRGPPHLA